MRILLSYLGTVAAVVITIDLVPGVTVAGLPGGSGLVTVLLVALVWSAISLTIKPVLHLLALPITILTFGLFALFLNALLFLLVALIVPGFVVTGFMPALVGSIVLSVLNWFIHTLFKTHSNL